MRNLPKALAARPLKITLALSLGLLGLCLSSCPPSQTTPPADPPKKTVSSATPLFEGWSDPLGVLVFTGDAHGYLEPCGCSEKQSGGFARRADLLRQLREERKWPVTALDNGGSLYDARVHYPQSKIKFPIMLKGLNEMAYKGLALGNEELMLGPQELYTQFTNASAEEGFDVPFLARNVTIFDSKVLGTPADMRIVEVGKLKVGVAAIVGNTFRQQLRDAGITRDENELLVEDPRSVLPGLIEKLKEQSPDLLVLLSHSEMKESEELARDFPEFQVVVTAGSVEDPRLEPVYIGETLLVQVGKKGKYAAVVGVFPGNQLKFELVELDKDRFANHPLMVDLMQDYQDRLRGAWPQLTAQFISDPPQGSYVGVDECKTCHTYAYGVWSQSKHSHAYDSLITGRPNYEGKWVSRIYDPECLACHATGWDPQQALRHASGFVDKETTPHLAGQQCENCHGPGSIHVELEKGVRAGGPVTDEVLAARKGAQLTLTEARTNLCRRCHDLDNSPNFDFDKYWNGTPGIRKGVNHTGRKD